MKYGREIYIISKTNRGSVSLLGAVLTSLVSLLLLFFALKMQVEYREAQYRKRSYLCFKYLTNQTKEYVSEMTKLNWALRTAYSAQFTGITTKEAVVIFKNLVIYRNVRHVSYVKNLLQNKYCSFPESGDFVKNIPYQVKNIFILDTALDETTKLKVAKWKNAISIIPKKIRASRIFFITVDFSLESAFSPNLAYSSKEIGKKGLLNLNL